jgi:predicted DNA-binding transcriptional regulator AlpA
MQEQTSMTKTKNSTPEGVNQQAPNTNDLMALQAITASGGEALIDARLVRQLIRGVSTATLYRMLAASNFPKPICVTPGRRAWALSAVQAWIKQRVGGDQSGRSSPSEAAS